MTIAPSRAGRRTGFHSLAVAKVDRLCADAVAVTLVVPEDLRAEFEFRAGQYLTLRRIHEGREERRSYSICAAEGAAPRIGVRRVDGGLFSAWLVDQVRVGDVLEVMAPQGQFSPDLGTATHHALVAAGSGITPVLSIVSSVLEQCPVSRITLLYGNRRVDTVMFAEELADLKDRYRSRLQLVHVLSRERGDADLLSGRLDADRLRRLLSTVVPSEDVDQWWLCGPYAMVRDAQAVLAERGVPVERVHQELFYVDEPPPELQRVDEDSTVDGQVSAVELLLDGRQTVLTLPRNVPILDAAQRVRSDLPFACKGGVCGTCRARVTGGEVRMRRNFALSTAELDAGFVLTCQALPVSDQLTVDYDA